MNEPIIHSLCFSKRKRTANVRFLLALLLASALSSCCCSAPPSAWSCSCLNAVSEYDSKRMYLCPSNCHSGLGVELVKTACYELMYLNAYGLELPKDPFDPSKTPIYVSFRDHSYTTTAERYLGGQRLLIPEAVKEEIIDYLLMDQPVFIRVGQYETDIYPDKFKKMYAR